MNERSTSTAVDEWMTRDVRTIHATASLADAARAMREHRVGFLPVVDGSIPIGVVTDRDLAVRGLGRGVPPARTTVGELMTPNLATVQTTQGPEHAAQRMRDRRVRRVLVLDERNHLAGVVGVGDLLSSDLPEHLMREVLDTLHH